MCGGAAAASSVTMVASGLKIPVLCFTSMFLHLSCAFGPPLLRGCLAPAGSFPKTAMACRHWRQGYSSLRMVQEQNTQSRAAVGWEWKKDWIKKKLVSSAAALVFVSGSWPQASRASEAVSQDTAKDTPLAKRSAPVAAFIKCEVVSTDSPWLVRIVKPAAPPTGLEKIKADMQSVVTSKAFAGVVVSSAVAATVVRNKDTYSGKFRQNDSGCSLHISVQTAQISLTCCSVAVRRQLSTPPGGVFMWVNSVWVLTVLEVQKRCNSCLPR